MGIEVNGIDETHVWMQRRKLANRFTYVLKPGPEAFPTMPRDQHKAAPFQHEGFGLRRQHRRLATNGLRHPEQSIDHRIAGDKHAIGFYSLGQKILLRHVRGGEVEVAHHSRDPSVQLLGKGRTQIVATQSCLHMSDKNAAIERAQGGNLNSCRITLDQQHARTLPGQQTIDGVKESSAEAREALVRQHDIQFDVRSHAEIGECLMQHFAMLAGGAEKNLEPFRPRPQSADHGDHLDRLRPRAGKYKDFLIFVSHFQECFPS